MYIATIATYNQSLFQVKQYRTSSADLTANRIYTIKGDIVSLNFCETREEVLAFKFTINFYS